MKILAIDTTAKTATAALTEDDRLIAVTVLNTPNTHSVTLLPMIDGLLKGSLLGIDDIELFVCSAGPGSFTGVRIGVSTVKGLAFAGDKKCIGVSSLEALAHNVAQRNGIICPVMDARRGQLYNALFRYESGVIKRLTEDRCITAESLRDELCAFNDTVVLVGDGINVAKRALSGLRVEYPHEVMIYQNAYSVARLGYRTYTNASEDERACFTARALSPVYLRVCQAERERLERIEKENNNRT